jgi:peptide/nickel transport system substrate-binding protein
MMTARLLVAAAWLAGGLLSAEAAPQTTLRIGAAGNDVGTLDPHRAVATPDINLLSWMFNGLVRITPGKADPSDIEPDLAESWTTSDDKLTWTFKLRDNVACHGNYGMLTADDVVFSLKRAASKETSSFFSEYAAMDKVEAVDPKTVRITLKQPVPGFLGLLAPYHGGNIVCKKAVEALGDGIAKHPVGTGPFEFVEYTPQQYVKLKANEKYFRGAPHIKEILYRYIPSDASRDLAFQSGELDVSYGRSDESWVKRMRSLPNATVALLGPGELYNINLNEAQKPLDDIRVRQAVAHGIDRNALAKFKGESLTRVATSVVPEGYLGYAPQKLLAYDPEASKKLLAEAGFPNGVTLKAIQTTLPGMLTVMQAAQAQLKKAGINLDLVTVDHPTFHVQIRQDLSQVVLYAAARFPVADTYLTQFFDSKSTVGTPTAIANFSHCKAADTAIAGARAATDPEKQKALWAEAQKAIVDDVCAVPIFEMLQPWVWRKNFDLGYPASASLSLAPPITEKARFTE